MRYRACCTALVLLLGTTNLFAEDPCVSGLKPGQKPGPYSSVVSVGPERGQSHCFICETAERPAVIIFARTLNDPLGRLARKLDRALVQHKAGELRAWITLLNDNQPAFDPLVVDWGKKHALRNLPVSVFEDADGPPTYRLSREADVTVLLSVKQKVVRNFAFRAGELTPERIDAVVKSISQILPAAKK
jgi:hypothetical protein